MGLEHAENNLPDLMQRFALSTIVETGCHIGCALDYARRCGFTKFYSCDISAEMVAIAQTNIPEAAIAHINSIDFLKDILNMFQRDEMDEPVLFFLDAHFPSLYEKPELETEETRWPLHREMELIKKSRRTKDVIICDDIRCIDDPENPTNWHNLEERYRSHRSYREFIDLFKDTHDVRICIDDTGRAIFTPKV